MRNFIPSIARYTGYFSCVGIIGLLAACGGSDDKVASTPAPIQAKQLQSANVNDASAIALIAVRRNQVEINNITVPAAQWLLDQMPDGSHPCTHGGTMTLTTLGYQRSFTPSNCDTGAGTLLSGSMTMNFSNGQSYTFNHLSYTNGSDMGVQTIDGQFSTNVNGLNSSGVGNFTITHNQHVDSYTNVVFTANLLPPNNLHMSMTVRAPQFTTSLDMSYNDATKVFVVSAPDGSNITLTSLNDGRIQVDLRNDKNGAIIATRTLTEAELAAAIAKLSQ